MYHLICSQSGHFSLSEVIAFGLHDTSTDLRKCLGWTALTYLAGVQKWHVSVSPSFFTLIQFTGLNLYPISTKRSGLSANIVLKQLLLLSAIERKETLESSAHGTQILPHVCALYFSQTDFCKSTASLGKSKPDLELSLMLYIVGMKRIKRKS